MLWGVAGGCTALAAIASRAERRRLARQDAEAVGWMPWALLTVLAMLAAALAAALALKA